MTYYVNVFARESKNIAGNVPRWIIVRHGKGAWIQWEEDIPPGNGCPDRASILAPYAK